MRTARRKRPQWPARVGGVLAARAILAVLLVLQLLPGTPKTTREWVFLCMLGPPAYVELEWASSRLFSAKTGARISSARFSLARVAIALVVVLVALAPLGWWLLRSTS